MCKGEMKHITNWKRQTSF